MDPRAISVVVESVVDDGFVGRGRERAELRTAIADARAGQGQVFMVSGDPGIGKTRLARATAADARARGFTVAWGRCWEDGGAPAYWPWIQLFRHCLTDPMAAVRVRGLPGLAAWVAQLMPDLRDELGDPLGGVGGRGLDAAQARFAAFDAVATLLRELAATQPLLLLLEDLHATDVPSLELLKFVARELPAAAILVVGTYREVELTRREACVRLLGDLARDSRALPLRGLSPRDITRFIQVGFDLTPSPAMVDALARATAGNPFFLDEVARVLAAEGRLEDGAEADDAVLRIPTRVHDALRRRLELVPPPTRDTLAVAAVIGHEFDVALLAAGCGSDLEPTLSALDQATAAGILLRRPGASGRHRFVHALMREAVYADLGSGLGIALHRRVGAALETRYAADLDRHLAELAHHFCAAAPGGDVEKAIDYATRAGARALRSLAYEDAVLHFTRAREVETLAAPDEHRRCELILQLGEAQARAGDLSSSRDSYAEAAEIARRIGSAHQFCRAALGHSGPWLQGGIPDLRQRTLLTQALTEIGHESEPLRALMLSRLTSIVAFTGDVVASNAMSLEALQIARRAGGGEVLTAALGARFVAISSTGTMLVSQERMAIATEAIQLAIEIGDDASEVQARMWRGVLLLESGQLDVFDHELAAIEQKAQQRNLPLHLYISTFWRSMRSGLAGDLQEAERLAKHAEMIARRAHDPNGETTLPLSLFVPYKEQGRLRELEAAIEHPPVPHPIYHVGLALVYAETGRTAEARKLFEELAASGFADSPRDYSWLNMMAMAAEICAHLRETRLAAMLLSLLAPYADRCVVISAAAGFYGSAAHYLGLLASTVQSWPEAEAHFMNAAGVHERLRAPTWLARTRYEYAAMLVERDGPGDREHAGQLLAEILPVATDLGMTVICDRAGRLRDALVPAVPVQPSFEPSAAAAGTATNQPPAFLFRRDGDYWTIAYEGSVCRMKDAKGLHYLARLLAHPGRTWHVLELLRGDDADIARHADFADGLTPTGHDDAGPILDPAAKHAYRQRLRDVEAERDDARTCNDLGRLARAEAEIAALTRELSHALGLGGRDRRFDSAAERARLNVTRAIKSAVARITTPDPALGRHLTRTVKTGLTCSYDPDPRAPITWTM